jgi:vacuolar-type H+-ATPase subunit H
LGKHATEFKPKAEETAYVLDEYSPRFDQFIGNQEWDVAPETDNESSSIIAKARGEAQEIRQKAEQEAAKYMAEAKELAEQTIAEFREEVRRDAEEEAKKQFEEMKAQLSSQIVEDAKAESSRIIAQSRQKADKEAEKIIEASKTDATKAAVTILKMARNDLEDVAKTTAALRQQLEKIEQFISRAGQKLSEKVGASEGINSQAIEEK